MWKSKQNPLARRLKGQAHSYKKAMKNAGIFKRTQRIFLIRTHIGGRLWHRSFITWNHDVGDAATLMYLRLITNLQID